MAVLHLDRPDQLNALDDELMRALPDALRALGRDPEVRAVVFTGSGRAFCAGGDLHDLGPRLSAGIESARQLMLTYHEVIRAIQEVDLPVIAAVDGACAGAGFSLAAACDLVVAGRSVRFVPAFTTVGLVPDLGALHFWVEALGPHRAKELAMLGEPMTADVAAVHGLVNHVVDDGGALAEATKLGERLASGPSASYAMIKSIVNGVTSKTRDDVMALEAFAQAAAFRTSEFDEGVAAFRAKRPPAYGPRQVGSR
ncbi:enoyl-CoA hydratase/isomerase family protein [Pseudonocardia sp. McavD-2-B]|uniref:enoyl-CoA hydratase/isomerase family protein n=1 Tax=Pseudonocardia sp. McavD-2-B TaxID=2954499 RepID=UPI002096CB1B|nr:enoyl-CoA hydratase-related protein [Pseudonocardia sp. McavD-2-B]MCO7191511.1 enoyl-CoA hydratase-related protein [Pseudonocardia sp. McavD-2-B]